jgi:hypothetical protein
MRPAARAARSRVSATNGRGLRRSAAGGTALARRDATWTHLDEVPTCLRGSARRAVRTAAPFGRIFRHSIIAPCRTPRPRLDDNDRRVLAKIESFRQQPRYQLAERRCWQDSCVAR